MNTNEVLPYARYRLLDAFRGMAILWIVVFHLLISVSDTAGFIFGSIIKNGFLGVSVFFVISGYGIAASHFSHSPSAHVFLIRRLTRIYPCYWWSLLFAAFIIPLLQELVLAFKTHSFTFLWPYTFFDLIQVITLTKVFSASSWGLNTAFDPYNGPVWYLAVIVQIYVFVALCVHMRRHTFVLLYCLYISSLLTYVPSIKNLLPYGIFIPYFAQCFIGYIVYQLLRRDTSFHQKVIVASVSLFPLIIIYIFAVNDVHYLSLSCATISGFVFLLLHRYDAQCERLLIFRVFYILGMFSYSLYLLHFPLRILGSMIAKNIFSFVGGFGQPFVVTVIAIVISFIWYLFFEKPSCQIDVIKSLLSPIGTISSGIDQCKTIISGTKLQ